MAGYDSSKRSAGGNNGGAKPAAAKASGNGYGRGGAKPAGKPKQGGGDKPKFNLQQFDPNGPEDNKSWFVGAGWPITNKQSGDDTGGISLIVELTKCQVTQDKEGNDIVRINLWPRKEQAES